MKLLLFYLISRSVISYGAQVWRWNRFEEIEKLQRHFECFGLPSNIASDLLQSECEINSIRIKTNRHRVNYIQQLSGDKKFDSKACDK